MSQDLERGEVSEFNALEGELKNRVLGSGKQVRLLSIALLSHGHVLIQGAPGLGKTTLAKSMAAAIDCSFKRLQFTPDLLPADILGYSIFDQPTANFVFHEGPIFCNVLLADEINRTTPRIQSALLEAMNEGQVSIDRQTRIIEPPFFVIATQNHLYATGTFPLPESQLDRFLVSFEMKRPNVTTQAEILKLHMMNDEEGTPNVILSKEHVLEAQKRVCRVVVCDELTAYTAQLVDATHGQKEFVTGISARGALALMRCAQANAYLHGRKDVYPDDIKEMMPYAFAHRLALRSHGRNPRAVVLHILNEILDTVAVP
ncbi:hypothetical protein BVY04_01755 [bacterium M21]|nr:hypothetical protein BVY04_01755 [bacterium M21]